MKRLALLILAALLTATAVAFATGTLSVPVNFGSLSAGVHNNLSDFDSNFSSIVSYVNAREITQGTCATRPAAGVSGRLFFCTDTSALYADTGSAWTTVATQNFYTDQLSGLTTEQAAVGIDQVKITNGAAASDDATLGNRVLMTLASTTQGNTAGTWVAGNFQNKLDSGAIGNNQTWHMYVIQRTDTGAVDILFSQSYGSPVMPTNYTKKRAIGAFLTNGAGNIRTWVQRGDTFLLSVPVLDVNSAGTTTGTTAFTASATVANGVECEAILAVQLNNNTTTGWLAYVAQNNTQDDAPSSTVAPLSSSPNPGAQVNTGATIIRVFTDATRNYRIRTSAGAVADVLRIVTLGFVYPRRP